MGKAAFRAQFEQAKQIEAGKQQALEAFQRFKAEQQAQQRQAELARQQAEQREKERLQEHRRSSGTAAPGARGQEAGAKRERGGPGRSR